MGKTRDLFKKIRDSKGALYGKMGSIEDRKVRGGKKTQKNCTKKIFMNRIIMMV